jgi:hypothetical protein
MLCSVALVRTDESGGCIAFIIRVTRMCELGTLVVAGSSVPTISTRRNIPEDGILHSQSRENLKSYKALTDSTL